MTESELLQRVQLQATTYGHRLFRNNIGQYQTHSGQVVRYGLFNPGGSDLIGWKRVQITSDMVGSHIAVFLAIETKIRPRKPTSQQINFIDIVTRSGGIASVVYDLNEAMGLLK